MTATHVTLRARERNEAIHEMMASEPSREWTYDDLAPLVRKLATRRELRHAIRSLIVQRRIEIAHRATGGATGLPSTYRVLCQCKSRVENIGPGHLANCRWADLDHSDGF